LGPEGERNAELGTGWLEAANRETARADIAKRIRRACAHLPEEEFWRLVDSMTDRQLRGERRLNWDFWKE